MDRMSYAAIAQQVYLLAVLVVKRGSTSPLIIQVLRVTGALQWELLYPLVGVGLAGAEGLYR